MEGRPKKAPVIKSDKNNSCPKLVIPRELGPAKESTEIEKEIFPHIVSFGFS